MGWPVTLFVSASGATEIAPGMWSFEMPPHQVRLFGDTHHSLGAQSVLLLARTQFDPKTKQLQFEFDGATPINIGTTSKVIGLAIQAPVSESLTTATSGSIEASLGPGDREFMQLARRELSAGTAKAAEALLLGVRARSAGNLKRGQSRNFSETPDNFWYAIVQPRVDEISITVRGSTDHFSSISKLEIKDDRGNTRFKVRSEDDVSPALDLIFHALRKR